MSRNSSSIKKSINKYSDQEYINLDLFGGDESKVECETSNMGIDLNKTTKICFPDPFPSRFCKPPID